MKNHLPRKEVRREKKVLWVALTLASLLATWPLAADAQDGPRRLQLIIDTDAGLDDMVALALCLQEPRVSVRAIVLSDGVLSVDQGVKMVGRLLVAMGRTDVPMFGPSPERPRRPAPPFRSKVWKRLDAAQPMRPGSTPGAMLLRVLEIKKLAHGPVTLLALGPMGSLQRLLRLRPDLRNQLTGIVAAGAPGRTRSWNARFHPEAWTEVARAGVPVTYLVHGPAAKKPAPWAKEPPPQGATTRLTPAGLFVRQLLSTPEMARHYALDLAELTDELPLFYILRPSLFAQRPAQGAHLTLDPTDSQGLFQLFNGVLLKGN